MRNMIRPLRNFGNGIKEALEEVESEKDRQLNNTILYPEDIQNELGD